MVRIPYKVSDCTICKSIYTTLKSIYMTLENNNMAHTKTGSALLALRARALAKFGEVDTVPVIEDNPFKIEKKNKNIRKKVFVC